jgi:hypothetical protein
MDLTFLKPVYDASGPYATVYLNVGRTDESGLREAELRWRAAAERLTEAGAPQEAVDALAERALEPPQSGGEGTRVLVASASGDIVLERTMSGDLVGDQTESTTWGPLPDLLPLLKALHERVPYIVVLADRVGADIEVHGYFDSSFEETSVDGSTHHINKVNVGGWAHKRYQQETENLWHENLREVAAELDRLAARSGARVVALAGDQRARTILQEHLGEAARELVLDLEAGGRAEGASREALDEDLSGHLEQAAATEIDRVIESLEQGRASGLALDGLGSTLEALRKGQVERLLVSGDSGGSRVWIGSDPLVVGLSAEELRGLGEESPTEVDATSAAVRAAAGADAAVTVLPAGTSKLADGIGAVLRYSDASTDS